MGGERRDPFGQRRIIGVDVDAAPMDRRGGFDRRIEIVAERGPERGFETFLHREQIDDRRPQMLDVDLQHLGQRLGLGVEAVGAPLGFCEGLAGDVERLAGAGLGGFGAQHRGFRLGHGCLRRGDGGGEAVEFGAHRRMFVLEPAAALFVRARGAGELRALRGQVGERSGEFGKSLFGRREDDIGLGDAGIDAEPAVGRRRCLLFERRLLGSELAERVVGVGGQAVLAGDVVGELDETAIELGHALLGARLLAIERLAGDHEPLQGSGGARLGVAQRRQCRGGDRLLFGGFGLRQRTGGDLAHAFVLGALGVHHLLRGGDVAQMEQGRFGLAHLLRHGAIAHCLARLALERVHLLGELADDVFETRQVLLGGAQAQLRLVATRMQAGNAGGFFEDAAALFGLGLDDLADPALVHEGGRTGPGRGVGEQDLDVAGAHLAAVDAIGRALLALDAARDLDRLLTVELGRRRAVGIVDRHADFGGVALRAVVVAGEDDVFHVGRAHGLVRGLAHHPA